jgi:hypothetical protein
MESLGPMEYALISEDEYAALSDDDEECFAQLEAICNRNMVRLIDQKNSTYAVNEIRMQYMAVISGAAEECGIPAIHPLSNHGGDEEFYDQFQQFCISVQRQVARIRVRGRNLRDSLSVQLAPTTRTKIEHYIGRIRTIIDTSDLAKDRKRSLVSKLDELMAELSNRRVGFGRSMSVLSAILLGLAASTTIAAEGPAAVSNIMKLIAADKETEEAAKRRLAPPPRALPAPPRLEAKRQAGPQWDASTGGDLDDEIPF